MIPDETPALPDSQIDALLAYAEAVAGGCDPDLSAPVTGTLGEVHACLRLIDQVWQRLQEPAHPLVRIGRFTIVRELGRGGYGVVFLAEDPALHRRVALKVPHPGVLATPELRRRFRREAEAASRLDHPHIVPVFEVGEAGAASYIASAYCAGSTLAAWLRARTKPVPPRLAAELVVGLARGLQHAHERAVLHRDLKPSNILLTETGQDDATALPVPRIADFGLAKLLDEQGDQTGTGALIGSPPYMAPEQAEGRLSAMGPATDVYGLGAILYEILTGRPPFQGQSHQETLRRVATEDTVPPRRRRPGLPRDLETICLTCLAKNPQRRYPSAAALAADLERYLEGRSIAARPTPAWQRVGKWARRRPSLAVLAGLAPVLIAGAIGGLWWYHEILMWHHHELTQAERANQARLQSELASQHDRQARRHLANYHLHQAQQEHDQGRDERAQQLLESARESYGSAAETGFDWSYLQRQTSPSFALLSGHPSAVWRVAFSPDSQVLASGDMAGVLRFWDLVSGRSWPSAQPHKTYLCPLAFSPDGQTLAASSFPHGRTTPEALPTSELNLWNVATGRLRAVATGLNCIPMQLWFSTGGDRIVSRQVFDPASESAQCWPLADPSRTLFPEATGTEALKRAGLFDARVQALADVLDGSASLTDEVRRKCLARIPQGMAYTRDRRILVLGQGDGSFSIFRSHTLEAMVIGRLSASRLVLFYLVTPVLPGYKNPPATAAEREQIARLGRLVATGTGPPEVTVLSGSRVDDFACFTPDGGTLVLWKADDRRLHLLDTGTGRERKAYRLGDLDRAVGLACSPDGTLLAVGSADHRIGLLRLAERPPPRGHTPKEAWSVAWSGDGRTVFSAGDDHMIRVWDPVTGQERAAWSGHDSLVTALRLSPDGATLASAGFDRTVRLWDITRGTMRAVLRGHTDRVRAVVWSPDGRRLASTGSDATIRIWDVATGRPIGEPLQMDQVIAHDPLAWSSDGRTLVSGGRDALIVWDLISGRGEPVPTTSRIRSMAFAPGGAVLAIGRDDGLVQLWDTTEKRFLTMLGSHSRQVLGVAWSPNGHTLASCGIDGTTRLWDPVTGQETLTLTGPGCQLNGVAFDPDGCTLAAAAHDGAIPLWRTIPHRGDAAPPSRASPSPGSVAAISSTMVGRSRLGTDRPSGSGISPVRPSE